MSDMGELFSRDPLKLTKEDRTEIIKWFRDNRAAFMTGQKVAKATAKPAKKGASAGIPGLGLDELDL